MTWSCVVDRPGPFVRVCIPLPRGFSWNPQAVPFALKAPDGTMSPAQWERVALYPENNSNSVNKEVAVAELIAKAVPGVTGYTIVPLESNAPPLRDNHAATVGPWARSLFEKLAVWVDGQKRVPKFAKSSYRFGRQCVSTRFSGRNFFGYVTVFDGLDVAEFHLVIHAATAGMPDLTFATLELEHADGRIGFESVWPEPDVRTNLAGRVELAKPRDQAHLLVQRGVRQFHGWLHNDTPAALSLATTLSQGAGQGISAEWTEDFARWQAHALPLPKLASKRAALRIHCDAEWAEIQDALRTGGPIGMGTNLGRADWLHPWGIRDGGTTGGGYRHQWAATECVVGQSLNGIRELQARLQMIQCRDAVAILDDLGRPALLEEFLNSGGHPDGWQMSEADARFDGQNDGAVGFSKQPKPSPMPPEWNLFKQPIAGGGSVLAYENIDWQHRDRSTQPAVALALLTNNPIAGWWVKLSAEMWRWSRFSAGRLHGVLSKTLSKPHSAAQVGRADAHGFTCMANAYMLSDRRGRNRLQTYMQMFVEILTNAQGTTGLFRAHHTNKEAKNAPFGDGTVASWAVTKASEEALLAGALLACARQLSVDVTPEVERVLDVWCDVGLWQQLWRNGDTQAPLDYRGHCKVTWAGVPLKATYGALLDIADTTNPVPIKGYDKSEVMAPLGAWWLFSLLERETQISAPLQLAFDGSASRYAGSPDPLSKLNSFSVYKAAYDDTAPLIAALERV